MPTPPTSAHLAAQRDAYETLLEICLANPNCKNFFLWGLNDGSSWIPGQFPGQGAPLLFDDSFNPKPAYAGLQAVFQAPVASRTSRNEGSMLLPRKSWNEAFDLRGRALGAF